MNDRNKMRVKIAKDVLKLLEPPKPEEERIKLSIKPKTGYFKLGISKKDAENEKIDLQTLFAKPKVCHVCALGSMFVAKVMRKRAKFRVFEKFDESVLCDGNIDLERDEITDELNDLFSFEEMDFIETWFECNSWDGFELESEVIDIANKADDNGINGKTRLKKMMEWIVNHNGELNQKLFISDMEKEIG